VAIQRTPSEPDDARRQQQDHDERREQAEARPAGGSGVYRDAKAQPSIKPCVLA